MDRGAWIGELVITLKVFVKHLGYKSHKGGKASKGLKTIKAHIKYIESRKDERGERTSRELFGKDGPMTRQEFYRILKGQPEKGVIAHKLCFSMSREDYEAQKIDLKRLTKDTISEWEFKTGRQYNWIACIHDKASNPHVHIVLAGRDTDGKEIAIMKRDLERLKKLCDEQRELQAERNLKRAAEKEYDFDPFKQIEYEASLDKELEKSRSRELEQEKAREKTTERELGR